MYLKFYSNRTAIIFCLLFCQCWILSAQDLDQDKYCNKVHGARHLFNPLLRANPLTDNYDLKYYRFEWTIDPNEYAIKGVATPYFKVLEDGFKEINFDFSSALIIDSIVWHGEKLAYSQAGLYQLNILIPTILPVNSLDSISIVYHGVPPSGGFGSFIQDSHNGEPILWTLSEPFGAQDWWPCKNGLDDKIDSIDVTVITQATYRAASNGSLSHEYTLPNDMKAYHWKHRYPITPYLVAIAVTNYTTYVDEVLLSDGTLMPMVNYVYPESLTNAKNGTKNNVKALQFFDSLFVAYPFKNEKYGHAQFGWGGGMEHQTMSFVVNFEWGLLAHELAHQWFGDMVTCGTWEDIWLNEGSATYLEGLSRERFQSATEWYNWKSGKINSITSSPGGSVKVDNPTSVNRIFSSRLSYSKGSYLLHMLRWTLGDQLFFGGIRNYLNDRSYNYAVTSDLQSHLEAISGIDLDEFFKDWYVGQGFPTYQLTWEQEGTTLGLKIEQSSSHESVSFFEMPVPVRLVGQGRDTIIRLDHTFSGQLFELDPGFPVLVVQFDPELWLLSRSTVAKGDIISSSNEYNSQEITVFPNPVDNECNINIHNVQLGGTTYWELVDVLGQRVKKGNMINKEERIDVSELHSGLYLINVLRDKKVIYKGKLIKK